MAKVGVIMGSISDYETMKECCAILEQFEVGYDKQVVSAHRTPNAMFDYAETAMNKGFQVIIAAAGGAAHLPGMVAAKTTLPVIGVPIQSKSLNGLDSLLSIVQMPAGVPVATVAIGVAGAKNAALLAIQILATHQENKELQQKLVSYKNKLEQEAMNSNQQLND